MTLEHAGARALHPRQSRVLAILRLPPHHLPVAAAIATRETPPPAARQRVLSGGQIPRRLPAAAAELAEGTAAAPHSRPIARPAGAGKLHLAHDTGARLADNRPRIPDPPAGSGRRAPDRPPHLPVPSLPR